MSEAEAASSTANNKLMQKPGHTGEKWVAHPGAVDPRTLGKSGKHTHKMELYVDLEAISWLKNTANATRHESELLRYGIKGHKLDEFNKFVRSLKTTKVKK